MGDGVEDSSEPVLVATKLRPPAVRDQMVPRERLMERLRTASSRGLSLVACPAGFGKTTLLSAWHKAEAARKPMAWLTLDEGDDDPVVLWSYVIEALRGVCPAIGQSVSPRAAGSAHIADIVLPHLVNELNDQHGVTLILDDFHRLSAGQARESIAWFVDHAPCTFQLVLSTRTEPDLPLAALRAHGELLELRADDLRFTPEEADEFLNGRLALGLMPEEIDVLVDRMEGWPGLYLMALSLGRTADRRALAHELGTSSRHVIDFLETEVLDAHDPPMQALMLRSSILDRLSGPLCDAVLEQQDSELMLDVLSRSNLFLAPVDDEGWWYRFHPLFAQLLRVELERREPGLVPALHRRAYAWHRDHGTVGEAISHAIEAGAHAAAAELIESSWVTLANAGKYDTVLAWIRRFRVEVLNGDPQLLLVAAWVLSLSARREEAARAIVRVEGLGEFDGERPLPDGFSSVDASLTMLRAVFPWGDVGTQLSNGRRAAELEGPGSQWRPVAGWAVGMGLYWRGDLAEADRWFAESAALAPASGQWLAAGSSLAYRSIIAGEQGRLDEQRLLADQATELVRERGIEEAVGVVPLALGVSFALRGRPAEALPLIDRSVAVLRSEGQPIDLAQALLRQVPVLRALGERERSQAAIAEARLIIESCPDPGILTERLKDSEPCPQPDTGSGDEMLTERELRVLRLLASELSERDIGRELYVSHNTVHSHVRSIYRKLGVSSRAHALERTRELRLLARAGTRQEAGRPGSLPVTSQAS